MKTVRDQNKLSILINAGSNKIIDLQQLEGNLKVLVNIGSDSRSFADARLARVAILLQNRPVKVEDDVLTLLPGTAAVMLTD